MALEPIEILKEIAEIKARQADDKARLSLLQGMVVEAVHPNGAGTATATVGNLKATVSRSNNYRVDNRNSGKLIEAVGVDVFNKVFRTKLEVNKRELNALREYQPETYKLMADYLTATESVSVKVGAVDGV